MFNASRRGNMAQPPSSILCVEVPDTLWGRSYQAFIISRNDADDVPVIVTALEDFQAAGVQRLAEFNSHFIRQGRPVHFMRLYL